MRDARVLHEENGLVYSVATADQRERIAARLGESFSREPMSASLGLSAKELASLADRFLPECTTNGLSVFATPKDQPQTVAGVFISRDYKSPLPPGVPDEFAWFFPIATALQTVDEAYEAQRPAFSSGDTVDLWMVAVDVARFGRRGIANRLFELCSDLARDSGFKRCVTECTGHYSQSAARRAGYEEAARLTYADFRFDGEPVFAQIEAPHTHLVLYEKKL